MVSSLAVFVLVLLGVLVALLLAREDEIRDHRRWWWWDRPDF